MDMEAARMTFRSCGRMKIASEKKCKKKVPSDMPMNHCAMVANILNPRPARCHALAAKPRTEASPSNRSDRKNSRTAPYWSCPAPGIFSVTRHTLGFMTRAGLIAH